MIEDQSIIFEHFLAVATAKPDSVALQLVEGSDISTMSYAALLTAVEEKSALLTQWGVQPGYRVAIVAPTSIAWVIYFLAIARVRATAVAIDPQLDGTQLLQQFKASEPFLAIVIDSLSMTLSHMTVVQVDTHGNASTVTHALEGRAYTNDGCEDLAAILFTSGTTGDFKGVELTTNGVMHTIKAYNENFEVNAQDNVLCVLPAHHVFGLVCVLLAPLMAGARISLINKIQPHLIIDAFQRVNPTIFIAVPRLLEFFASMFFADFMRKSKLQRLINQPLIKLSSALRNNFNLNVGKLLFNSFHKTFGNRLRYIVSGSAPLSAKLFTQLEALGLTIVEGYGLTETTSYLTANTLDCRKAKSVGYLIKGAEMKFHPIAGVGEELCVKGSSIMRGYFRNKQATEEAIVDGWFHTGDLGHVLPNGMVALTGRIKDIVVLPNGKKVATSMVEEYYKGIAEIEELAIVGVPDVDSNCEQLCAAVKISKSIPVGLNLNQFKQLVTARMTAVAKDLPQWWAIKKIYFVQDVPKTNTMKVKKSLLVKQLLEYDRLEMHGEHAAKVSLAPGLNHVDQRAKAILAALVKIVETFQSNTSVIIDLNSSLRLDLGLDSLSRMELLSLLQKVLNRPISDVLFSRVDSVADLLQLMDHTEVDSGSVVDSKTDKQQEKVHFSNRHSLLRTWFTVLFKLYYRVDVENKGHLPNEPYILCANHSSHLDGLSLILASGNHFTDFVVLAAKDYFFKDAFIHKIMRRTLNMLPFNRDYSASAMQENLSNVQQCLFLRKNIILFPEGTRSITGDLQEFKLGAALFADRLNVKLVPAYISGAHRLFPKGGRFPFPGKITIKFGEPLVFSPPVSIEGDSLERYTHYQQLMDQMRDKILELKSEINNEHQ